MSDCIETDVLIIGCGISGGVAALELADKGAHVTLVTRTIVPKESNTYYAQGGIIYEGEDDSTELLREDVIRAGAGLCNPVAVDILINQGAKSVDEILLKRLAVDFNYSESGKLARTREGGHSVARILHAADATGRAIEMALLKELLECPNISMRSGLTAVDILTLDHHSTNRLSIYEPTCCVGAYLFDRKAGKVIRCLAKSTILATGGLGKIFLRTTNPEGARGDGLAMAYRAGARVLNCEFVQFHPTVFYHQDQACFLISEAVRGEGAKLVDASGRPFMRKYAEKWQDLAPRDVVARSIHQEMLTRGVSNVYLDLRSYLSSEHIESHFPNIQKRCLEFGVNMKEDLVPVVPAAHYSCGGIWVNDQGQTTIRGLYAIGEVACTGVHGANRLASASLLEGLVWGRRAAENIYASMRETIKCKPDEIPAWQDTGVDEPDLALIRQDMSSIQHVMWNYVGLVRNRRRLKRAMLELRNLEFAIEQFYDEARLSDELIGLRNAARVAILVTSAAWKNRRSIGCHYRKD